MAGRETWFGLVLIAACIASLRDVGAVRTGEQLLAPLAGLTDGLVAELLPEPPAPAPDALVAEARAAWELYVDTVLASGRASPGRALCPVPVLARDRGRQQLTVRVPAEAVEPGAVVSHRGVLLGFVHAVDGDEAVVRLLGHPRTRAIAAEWQTAKTARPVWFLLRQGAEGPAIESRSSSVAPPDGQLAWTRDVSDLGDTLPPRLLLGRLAARDPGMPGGASGVRDELELAPLVDPFDVSVVVVEVRPGAALSERRTVARLSRLAGGDGRRRVDVGARHGVRAGDQVVQDGVWVGELDVVGPYASEVVWRAPGGQVLVLDGGDVVPCRTEAEAWPEGWRPVPGAPVASGLPAGGGVLLGVVDAVDEERFTIEPAPVVPTRAVTVEGR